MHLHVLSDALRNVYITGFKQCGSILLARTKDRMTLLKRTGVAARCANFLLHALCLHYINV